MNLYFADFGRETAVDTSEWESSSAVWQGREGEGRRERREEREKGVRREESWGQKRLEEDNKNVRRESSRGRRLNSELPQNTQEDRYHKNEEDVVRRRPNSKTRKFVAPALPKGTELGVPGSRVADSLFPSADSGISSLNTSTSGSRKSVRHTMIH